MRAEGKGGEGRRSSKKETKKQWKRTRAIFSAASRLIFPPLCMRACVRARTRHGPMTSIHFHARMENSGAGERGMETEGRGRKLTRDKRYFSRRGVKESSLRASFRTSLKKKKGSGRIKNELNVDVNDAARPPFRFIYRNICANLFVSRNEFHYEGTRELGMDLILLENGSTPR